MKRGAGPKRKTSLKRTGGLERRTALARGDRPLKRTNGPRRKAPPRPTVTEREMQEVVRDGWNRKVKAVPCLMCTWFPVASKVRKIFGPDLRRREGHHVIGKRHLKRARLEHLYWDSDDAICLCHYHHSRHESAKQRVPYDLLPARCIEFADRIGHAWVLDREYSHKPTDPLPAVPLGARRRTQRDQPHEGDTS